MHTQSALFTALPSGRIALAIAQVCRALAIANAMQDCRRALIKRDATTTA